MKRKKDDDPHQSSLDSFANIELPSMPDLDKLAKADKILKENQQNEWSNKHLLARYLYLPNEQSQHPGNSPI